MADTVALLATHCTVLQFHRVDITLAGVIYRMNKSLLLQNSPLSQFVLVCHRDWECVHASPTYLPTYLTQNLVTLVSDKGRRGQKTAPRYTFGRPSKSFWLVLIRKFTN